MYIRLLLSICFFVLTSYAAEDVPVVVVALPFYGGFVQKPDSTATGAQILGDLKSFISVMGSPWNVVKLTTHQSKIASLGKEIEKTETGSFNILHEVSQQAKSKGYGTISEAMQNKLACSIVRQPIVSDIQMLLSTLRSQGVGILGYGNQDEKEYNCFEKYCSQNNIGPLQVCSSGAVIYRHRDTVQDFSSAERPFLQKNNVTVAREAFPHSAFLSALCHRSKGSHLILALPPHLNRPAEREFCSHAEVIPFTTISALKSVLIDRGILHKKTLGLRDIL